MTSRVKASLFDILNPYLQDALVLDLFAGTGQLGIEALSRGAHHCTFVELDRKVISVTRKNIQTTGMESQSTLLQQNVLTFLNRPATQSYDLVLVSPPQYKGFVSSTLQALDNLGGPLHTNTLVAIQQSSKEPNPSNLRHLEISDIRNYGSTNLLFYQATRTQSN